MWIFLGLIVLAFTAVGGTVAADARRRAKYGAHRAGATSAADLAAARARLLAAGEDVDAIGHVGGGVYVSASARDTAPDAPVDARIVELTVDPTLSEVDVATAVEHVTPGVGSLTSFAATACDTREMRTTAEQRELEAVYEAAHDENTVRDLDAATGDLWDAHADVWATIDAWVEKYHGKEHYASCVHCTRFMHVQSDEYAQLVRDRESEHTGEISEADIRAMYALQGATT